MHFSSGLLCIDKCRYLDVASTPFVVDIVVVVIFATDDVTFQPLECLIQLFDVRMKNHQVGLFFLSFFLLVTDLSIKIINSFDAWASKCIKTLYQISLRQICREARSVVQCLEVKCPLTSSDIKKLSTQRPRATILISSL